MTKHPCLHGWSCVGVPVSLVSKSVRYLNTTRAGFTIGKVRGSKFTAFYKMRRRCGKRR